MTEREPTKKITEMIHQAYAARLENIPEDHHLRLAHLNVATPGSELEIEKMNLNILALDYFIQGLQYANEVLFSDEIPSRLRLPDGSSVEFSVISESVNGS